MVELSQKFFRPGTQVEPHIQGFIVGQGGLGDCIGLSTAIVFIAKHYPNVIGHVFTHDFFVPILKNFLKDYPEWKVFELKELTQDFLNKHPIKFPTHDPIGRLGAHAVDLGFIYYLNVRPTIRTLERFTYEEANLDYPFLDLKRIKLNSELKKINYVVMTPIATNCQKRMIPKCFNEIKDFFIERNITPVFLGKGIPPTEYNLENGLNYLNKTSILDAAKILSKAKVVIGIDNGLLHLAACTYNTKIVFGYTVSEAGHTRPRTNIESVTDIEPKTLNCYGCQSNMRFMTKPNGEIYNFNDGCFYGDDIPECVSERHLGDPKRWINAIKKFL